MKRLSKAFYVERARAGGLARKRKLTAEQLREIGQMGAQAYVKRTTKAQRSEAARQAVLERWKRYRAAKKKHKQTKPR